jgi:AcrR family transcriptional regulator
VPRPRSLDPDRLAEAALAVIDHAGLDGLTMRAVAQRLGMSTMALYRYVADRDELELLVAEWCLRGLDTTPPTDPEWTDQIRTMVLRVRAEIGTHPRTVPLLINNRHRCLAVLRWSETVTGILTTAGFSGTDRVIALRGVVGYVNGALLQEHLGPLSGAGTRTMAALPADRFPMLRETAADAHQVEPADEFAGGLDLLLRGLAVSRPDPRSADRAPR